MDDLGFTATGLPILFGKKEFSAGGIGNVVCDDEDQRICVSHIYMWLVTVRC